MAPPDHDDLWHVVKLHLQVSWCKEEKGKREEGALLTL